MTSRLKHLAVATLALVALGMVAPRPAQAELVDRILVQVNGEIITLSDFNRFFPIHAKTIGLSPADLATGERCEAVIESFVEDLTTSVLLKQRAQTQGMSVSQNEVRDYVRRQQEQMGISDEEFSQHLRSEGIELEDYREFIELNLSRMRIIQVEVGARVNVSEADVERALEELFPNGIEDIYLTTSHIFVQLTSDSPAAMEAGRAEILRRQARLQAGEPFESVAVDNADATATMGGRVGRIERLSLDPDYVAGAMLLEPGQVSDVVLSSFGYHLIRLEALERVPAAQPERVRHSVFMRLHSERAEAEQARYLARALQEAHLRYRLDDLTAPCWQR